jgi:hypothetical protein
MTTAREMNAVLDMIFDYAPSGDIGFRVKVIDVRERFGGTDYEIVPVAGSGKKWVASTSVRLVD